MKKLISLLLVLLMLVGMLSTAAFAEVKEPIEEIEEEPIEEEPIEEVEEIEEIAEEIEEPEPEPTHEHNYQPVTVTTYVCKICGESAPESYEGSTLSQGNVTILCSVGCLAVGFLAAMFIFKKKPATVKSSEE